MSEVKSFRIPSTVVVQDCVILNENELVQADSLEDAVTDLKGKFNKGLVAFIYRKSDGTARYAIGTTCYSFLPDKYLKLCGEAVHAINDVLNKFEMEEANFNEESGPRGSYAKDDVIDTIEGIVARVHADYELEQRRLAEKSVPKNTDLITYFDLGSNAWRSFRAANLLCFFDAE